jgi:hypothetical protein
LQPALRHLSGRTSESKAGTAEDKFAPHPRQALKQLASEKLNESQLLTGSPYPRKILAGILCGTLS